MFKYIYDQPQYEVAKLVADKLSSQLSQGKSVLWLLSGGSGGDVCVEASKLLVNNGVDLSKLYVTFSDERFGQQGHTDENYRILTEQGLSLPGAVIYRPLQGESNQTTADEFAKWLVEVSSEVDYKFAVMGIGADGHTAGAKPLSPALYSKEAAEVYLADDFERLTITISFIRKLDEAVVQAYGRSKHEVVNRFLDNQGELDDFPALVIYDIPKVTMFSDFVPNTSSS